MARVNLVQYEETEGKIKEAFDAQIAKSGSVTNMKKALLNDIDVYDSYLTWYPLYSRVNEIVGNRAAVIFAHAISTTNNCLLCSLFFISDLKALGEDPNSFELNEKEELLSQLGQQIVKDPSNVSDELFVRLKENFTDQEIVVLVGFAGQMIATNNFNSVLKVDVDQRLVPIIEDFKPATWRENLQ
ncbi:carboxymuconolactone decarboxylase family protein [Scatolibacter rhodanostii]|uniref:carboxymuconolactone decarboxylase family protein n=1 Tax=Scatolibacter rhodanostii TaxID=2014781 RepID=UPI000C06DE90|nr:hypothetical protein [Scatolibacter rhodanostii]